MPGGEGAGVKQQKTGRLSLRGWFGRAIGLLAAQTQRYTAQQAAELLIHDAQEMNHLAAILPELDGAFGPQFAAARSAP